MQCHAGQILHHFVTDHTLQEHEDFNDKQLCVGFLVEDVV